MVAVTLRVTLLAFIALSAAQSSAQTHTHQRRIQDFPRGGRQHTILPKFPENCMKSKEFGCPGGGRAPCAPPPKSPTAHSAIAVIDTSNNA